MFAVISDIHGNLEALEAVLNDIDKRGIKKIYCLGDIVGYGANPRECIDIIRNRKIKSVIGNHDYAVANKDSDYIQCFNSEAREAIFWTIEQLKEEYFLFLQNLPFVYSFEDYFFSHASLVKPEEFRYLYKTSITKNDFIGFDDNLILFIGHTHKPFKILFKDDKICPVDEETAIVEEMGIFNIGSVGQPRDSNNKACYAVCDDRKIQYIRIDYDIETAAEKIRKAGMPYELAERLLLGK